MESVNGGLIDLDQLSDVQCHDASDWKRVNSVTHRNARFLDRPSVRTSNFSFRVFLSCGPATLEIRKLDACTHAVSD